MSKKAIAPETFGVIAVLMVLLIFMMIFAIKAGTSTNKIVEDSECAKSIKTHTFLIKTTGEGVASDIYCPTKYYTLSGEDADETKNLLAEARKTCWGTWGRGQLNLFKGEGYYCHICSVIDFKDKGNIITGFPEYLANTKVSSALDISYIDYLTSYANEKADPKFVDSFKELSQTGTIDTSKTYSVVFLYAKGDKFIKDLLEGIGSLSFVGTGTTTAGGGLLGIAGGSLAGIAIAGILGLGTGGTITIVAAGAGIIGAVGAYFGWSKAKEVEWFSTTLLSEYSSENLQKIGCQITPVKQDKIQGVGG